MAHTFAHLLSHVIFSTKGRRPYIDAELKERLHPYMGGIMRELGGSALTINGIEDHVHLLVLLPPTLCMADAMRVLKTNSSSWVHKTYPRRRGFGWQTGYGAFSVSQSNVEEVSAYIARQEQHHRKVTFKEEFIAFLDRHGIKYDPRYVWE